jgi:integrase
MHQNKKGTVAVQSIDNRLRLQWTWAKSKGGDGKRYWLTLELDDDPVNRAQAELKAALIQRDIDAGGFDATLTKYRPSKVINGDIDLLNLFIQFIEIKKISLQKTSLEKYKALKKHIEQFFGKKPVAQIDSKLCAEFRDWLLQRQQPSTVYERLVLLSACFDWGIEQKLASVNPCKAVAEAIEVPAKEDPQPFEREEVRKIIEPGGADSGDDVREIGDDLAVGHSVGAGKTQDSGAGERVGARGAIGASAATD